MLVPDHPDIVGLCLLPALLYCLWRARRWHVYAGAFVATTILELVGTGFGNWRWADTVPGLGLPQGNPPSAIAAGYCLLDAIVLFLASRVWLARIPLGGARRRAAPGGRGLTPAGGA